MRLLVDIDSVTLRDKCQQRFVYSVTVHITEVTLRKYPNVNI